MTTMTTGNDNMAPHMHQCNRCKDIFEATCEHLHFKAARGYGQYHTRLAKPHEIPYVVASCSKPACAFGGF